MDFGEAGDASDEEVVQRRVIRVRNVVERNSQGEEEDEDSEEGIVFAGPVDLEYEEEEEEEEAQEINQQVEEEKGDGDEIVEQDDPNITWGQVSIYNEKLFYFYLLRQ